MKNLRALLAALLLPLCASAAVPFDWAADVDRPAPVPVPVLRGETVDLRAALVRRGRPFDPMADSATIYWQTNGMGDAWWSAPASVSSNVLSATFTPAMDPGATLVSAFIGTTGEDGRSYRAWATLRILHAPGAVPNELPLPARAIDFATVAWTNAPWALPGDIPASPVTSVNGQTGTVVLAAADVGAATVADATLTDVTAWVFASGFLDATQTAAAGTPVETDSHLELRASGEGEYAIFLVANSGTPPWEDDFGVARLANDGLSALYKNGLVVWQPETAVATRGSVYPGYQLGSQSDKPLAPAEDYALKSEIPAVPVKAVKRNGTALVPDAQGAVNVEVPTVPANISAFVNDASYLSTESDPTVPAWAKAPTPPVSAPTWFSADLGANASTNLAAAAGAAYRWTGSGALSIQAVTGLSPDPTYLVVDGFSSLSLPAGFAVAGSGAFRAGREVHLALWSTPTTNLVNFLFAR